MCDEQYDLLWWSEPPLVFMEDNSTEFDGVVAEQFFAAFQSCCDGRMPNFIPQQLTTQAEIMQQVRNLTIAMPISYESRVVMDDAGVFLRVLESSGLAFVNHPFETEGNLLTQGAETIWPLLILVLLLCGYAGLVFWLAEFTVKNKYRQIDRSFFLGMFDGYWFAFITATTVGYGDKVTGSRLGKFLTIIWLLFGLGLLASFTAAVTQLMSSAYFDASQELTMRDCKTVGVINGSLAQQMVTEMGLKPLLAKDFKEVHELVDNDTVKGMVLDQYFCSYYLSQIDEVFMIAMGQTERISSGIIYNAICPACDTLSMCMKRYLFVHYLDFVSDLEEKLNHRNERKQSALGMATQALGSDHNYLGIVAGVLAALILIAWAVDFLVTRHLNKKKDVKTLSQDEKQNDELVNNGAGEVVIAQ